MMAVDHNHDGFLMFEELDDLVRMAAGSDLDPGYLKWNAFVSYQYLGLYLTLLVSVSLRVSLLAFQLS